MFLSEHAISTSRRCDFQALYLNWGCRADAQLPVYMPFGSKRYSGIQRAESNFLLQNFVEAAPRPLSFIPTKEPFPLRI